MTDCSDYDKDICGDCSERGGDKKVGCYTPIDSQTEPVSEVPCSDRVMPLPIDRQPDETSIIGRPVLAIVQHWHTKGKRFAVLKGVNEDDHFWQTVDDGSELSHDWNVIAWDYLPEQKKA